MFSTRPTPITTPANASYVSRPEGRPGMAPTPRAIPAQPRRIAMVDASGIVLATYASSAPRAVRMQAAMLSRN